MMGKKSRTKTRPAARSADPAEVPAVGQREPCPCGSGKRYKLCHGRERRRDQPRPATRPFEGLPSECDWVALRELVPAATVPLRLRADASNDVLDSGGLESGGLESGGTADSHTDDPATGGEGQSEVLLCTALPFTAAGSVRSDGAIWLGLQVEPPIADNPSRGLAATLLEARRTEPGEFVDPGMVGADGPRMQDLLDLTQPLEITVHSDFAFWTADEQTPPQEIVSWRERADEIVHPTARLTSVEAAYWCRIGDRWHLRWVMPHEEERLLDALARLAAKDSADVGPGSRLVGSFRAHGRVVPVWDLAPQTSAEAVEEPAAVLGDRLGEALADTSPLSAQERRVRAGLTSRQVTIR